LRHLVYLTPDAFVLFDVVEAFSAKQFDWLLQAPRIGSYGSTLDVIGDTLSITRHDQVHLAVKMLEPSTFDYGPATYNEAHDVRSTYVRLHSVSKAPSARFLSTWFPLAAGALAPQAEKVSANNLIGVKVTRASKLDLVLFSTDGNAVDEWINLGAVYHAADGATYAFSGTKLRAQFASYEVIRLAQ